MRRLRAAFVAALVAGALAACAANQTSVDRVMEALGVDRLTLSQETRQQLDRFDKVYARYVTQPESDARLDYFRYAFRRVRTAYVRPVSDKALIDAAIEGVEKDKPAPHSLPPEKLVEKALYSMLESLDPHSDYMNARQFEETYISTKGEFGGLGIEVVMDKGLVKVVAPIEGTPAEKAGLESGDLITHVDGEPVKGKTLSDAVSRMRGAPGTKIVLTIKRGDKPEFDVTLTRAVIKVAAVRWQRLGDIGYVRVTRFSEKVESGIAKAMAQLRSHGDGPLRGVILDLRNNPGGLLDQSLILADSFLDSGEIVSVRGRRPADRRDYDASPGDLARNLKMVVLINGGSASASEIVASALQAHHRATLMGERSFGKGSVQTIMPLPLDGALRLTTALYYSPDGITIQGDGVHPDIVIQPDKPVETKHESDLPGSIPGEHLKSTAKPTISEASCPEEGKRKDRVLGCALWFLKAGSTKQFLAELAAKGKQPS